MRELTPRQQQFYAECVLISVPFASAISYLSIKTISTLSLFLYCLRVHYQACRSFRCYQGKAVPSAGLPWLAPGSPAVVVAVAVVSSAVAAVAAAAAAASAASVFSFSS